mmetsp:Transcript_43609/g.108541  ORF Transcript_43609/g.108541 Transcript_43609/m.108541 type:complete len:239 (-) Transcript_43609:122-838(-)
MDKLLEKRPLDRDLLRELVERAEKKLMMPIDKTSTAGKANAEIEKLDDLDEEFNDRFKEYKNYHTLNSAKNFLTSLKEMRKIGIKGKKLDDVEEEIFDDLFSELGRNTDPKAVNIDSAEWYAKLYQGVLNLRIDALKRRVENGKKYQMHKPVYEQCNLQQLLDALDVTGGGPWAKEREQWGAHRKAWGKDAGSQGVVSGGPTGARERGGGRERRVATRAWRKRRTPPRRRWRGGRGTR